MGSRSLHNQQSWENVDENSPKRQVFSDEQKVAEVKNKNVIIIISECCWSVIVHQNVCLIQGAIV